MGEEGEGGAPGAEEEAPGEVTQINGDEIGATPNLKVLEDKISANSSKNGSQDAVTLNSNLVKSDSLDTRVGQRGERDRRKVPKHRRFWESPDCSCSKEVIEEGDWEGGERPREGSAGEIRIWLEDVQGVTKEELRSTPALSKYLLSRNGNDELASQTEDFTKVEFTVGTGTTCVDRRLEVALATFLESEKSRLTLRVFIEPKFNSKEGGEPLWVTIVAVVQLVNLVQAEPLWRWFPETRLARAKDHYAAAVNLFKLSRWLDAFHLFQAAHRLALLAIGVKEKEDKKLKAGHQKSLEDHTSSTSSESRSSSGGRTLAAASLAEAWKLRTACCNNLAACHFQWGNHASVVQLSTVVLQVDPNQVKALYRRGVSYLEMKEFDFAERDLVAAHKVEPSNRAVSEALGQVKLRKKREQASMQAKMSKMFS